MILGLFDVRLQFDGIKDDALTYIFYSPGNGGGGRWQGGEGARNKEGGVGDIPRSPCPLSQPSFRDRGEWREGRKGVRGQRAVGRRKG